MARGTFIDPRGGRITFAEWCDQWLERPDKRLNSVVRDRPGLAVFLPDLGALPLAAITPMHVQATVDRAVPGCGTRDECARDFSALRAVFNRAVHGNLLGRFPCRNVALPKGSTARPCRPQPCRARPAGRCRPASLPGH